MSTLSLRTAAFGFILGTGALLLATASHATVAPAPLKGETAITKVAQGCGPGRWRGPGGFCVGPGRRHCWRGPRGGLHCD